VYCFKWLTAYSDARHDTSNETPLHFICARLASDAAGRRPGQRERNLRTRVPACGNFRNGDWPAPLRSASNSESELTEWRADSKLGPR
jgi:hypothetical protein